MANPTEKELHEAFPRLSEEDAKDLAGAIQAAEHPQYVQEGDMSIDDALEMANTMLSGSGVESLQPEGAWVDRYYREAILLYVNLGDTYDNTIWFDTDQGEFGVGSWGDFYEEWEQQQEEELESEEA